jgi:hypothetical protein
MPKLLKIQHPGENRTLDLLMTTNYIGTPRRHQGNILPFDEKLRVFLLRKVSQEQCCQMVYFQTKNPSLGKFWRALE